MLFQHSKPFYNYLKVVFLLSVVFCSCATKQKWKLINGEKYLNVKFAEIVGDNKTDNRQALEKILNAGGNYYFPKGIYLINSYSYVYNIVLVANNTKGLKLKFEDNAIIKAGKNLIPKGDKGCLLCFVSKTADIPFIEIENLQIDGNKSNNDGMINGVLFYEQPQFSINKVILNRARVINTSGGGIHTEATYTKFSNIYTENCGSHGIGVNQTFRPEVKHYIEIENHLSINDNAYSIDFSAPSDEKDEKKAKQQFQFQGKATNITSINSLYGIKTAGCWDLELNNIKIINSKNNGLFLSKDAPQNTVKLNGLRVANCGGNGLYLAGRTNFVGKNIVLDSCFAPLTIENSKTDIDTLSIKNNYRNIACIQINGAENQKVSLNHFSIIGNNKDNTYLINSNNDNLSLINGKIENNESPYFLYLGNRVKNCQLENIAFNNNQFHNIIAPDGVSKNIKISKIQGVNSQKLIRKLEKRQEDKLIRE